MPQLIVVEIMSQWATNLQNHTKRLITLYIYMDDIKVLAKIEKNWKI